MTDFPKKVADRLRDSGKTLRVKYGLRFWEEGSDLLLLPLEIKRALPDDLILTSIMGKTSTVAEADEDVRAGLVAYGIKGEQYEQVLRILQGE